MKLDQFYTKIDVAKSCYDFLLSKFDSLGISLKDVYFIEPSAGSGSFFNLIKTKNKIGFDIEPKGRGIKKQDFLKWDPDIKDRSSVVVVGNPPFGHRSKIAIDFFNKSSEFSDTIGMIFPVQFRKYSVHSKLNEGYKLVDEKLLPQNSFFTEYKKDFGANCVFQIWTIKKTNLKDKRIIKPPPTKHPKFEIYQYNNTKEALKVFNYNFDFAVPRQGYEDYTRREKNPDKLERTKQWALFKANDNTTKKRLFDLDFLKLAMKNTIIPGFGKADVIQEYQKIYD